MKQTEHLIDAAGRAPGRIASEAARFLQGKHKPTFTPHIDGGDKVRVVNVRQMKFTGKKLAEKELIHHTTHPGGIKRRPVRVLMQTRPSEVLHHAIVKMLPKNRQRRIFLTRLRLEA